MCFSNEKTLVVKQVYEIIGRKPAKFSLLLEKNNKDGLKLFWQKDVPYALLKSFDRAYS
jgi:hypothetical protein